MGLTLLMELFCYLNLVARVAALRTKVGKKLYGTAEKVLT